MVQNSSGKSQNDKEDDSAGAAQFSSLLSTYGAVPVNGKNMHQLLANGEIVLLYPGGAREVRPAAGVSGDHSACEGLRHRQRQAAPGDAGVQVSGMQQ